jgi:apocytochrome f
MTSFFTPISARLGTLIRGLFTKGLFTKGFVATIAALAVLINLAPAANAYPFWAQQNYPASPREATGKIVCANCHLAKKPLEVELPQSVLPDTVFKAIVKVPYAEGLQQVQGDGSKGGLNVGAVVMLPKGFTIAPADRISDELKEEVGDVYFQTYAEDQQNVILVGPMPGDTHREIIFPILSPDPDNDKTVSFGKYQVHVGANRGRGQVYPTGEKSNNTVYTTTVAGTIDSISEETSDTGPKTVVGVKTAAGNIVTTTIPSGPTLIVAAGEEVAAGAALTDDPNVGGFGQHDVEIVLQSSGRVAGLLVFFSAVMLAQILLVLKKKQIEKVQAAEMNF